MPGIDQLTTSAPEDDPKIWSWQTGTRLMFTVDQPLENAHCILSNGLGTVVEIIYTLECPVAAALQVALNFSHFRYDIMI